MDLQGPKMVPFKRERDESDEPVAKHPKLENPSNITKQTSEPGTSHPPPIQDVKQNNGGTASTTLTEESVQKLKVEDALMYLDNVKLHFMGRADVYSRFLDIMKEFKSQEIDTPAVIQHVSILFQGHPELIEGFNTFLPPGYKIEVPDYDKPSEILISKPGGEATLHKATPATLNSQGKLTVVSRPTASAPSQKPANEKPQQPAPQPKPEVRPPPASEGKPVPAERRLEFSHAIQYVNKIKSRFQAQNQVYKQFLEILHTYQRHHQSINDVYAQVASLFKDHPDLLEEFSQFLPEAVPAAKEHAERLRKDKKKRAERRAESTASKRRKEAQITEDISQYLRTDELSFFEKIKQALRPQAVYDNFLKCMQLFSNELIGEQELVNMVSPFLVKHPALFSWFKEFIGYHGSDRTLEGPQGLDLSQCLQHDQSYRLLPEGHQNAKCSGRANLAPEILATLNNKLVSFPCWSEDSNFVTSKKNPNEETLFRCEDERFELDIIMEANLATIRNLEHELRNLQERPPEMLKSYAFNAETLGGSSKIIHTRALQRLYGDHLGEVIQALKRDPRQFIPVVLNRLKQKHSEWREAKRQWNEAWRETVEKNYLKSLDYKHTTFKRNDPNTFKPKIIRTRFKDMRDEYRQYRKRNGAAVGEVSPPPPRVVYEYEDVTIFDHIERLLQKSIQGLNNVSSEVKEKMMQILGTFVRKTIFGLPDRQVSLHDLERYQLSKSLAEFGRLPKNGTKDDGETTPMDQDQDENENDDDDDDKDEPSVTASVRGADEGPLKPVAKLPSTGIEAMMTKVVYSSAKVSNSLPFYTNGRWFVFFVQHQLLFERLQDIRKYCDEMAEINRKRTPDYIPLAIKLALRKSWVMKTYHYFETFLSLTERLMDSTIDPAAYEESVREICHAHAYKAFTIDKLCHAIVRQLQSLLDEPSQQLQEAYQNCVSKEETDYRKHALSILSDDNSRVYLIEKLGDREFSMELVDMDDGVDDRELTATEAWMRYVHSFVDFDHINAEILRSQQLPVFLARNARAAGFTDNANAMKKTLFQNQLECHFSVNSYKMVFLYQTNDFFARLKPQVKDFGATSSNNEKRRSRFKKFHDGWLKEYGVDDDTKACDAWLRGEENSQVETSVESSNQFKIPVTVYKTKTMGVQAAREMQVEEDQQQPPQPPTLEQASSEQVE